MEKTETDNKMDKEKAWLTELLSAVCIAEKKARIYSRLLTDVSLAKAMEDLANRHETQKTTLQALLGEKTKKEKKSEGAEQ